MTTHSHQENTAQFLARTAPEIMKKVQEIMRDLVPHELLACVLSGSLASGTSNLEAWLQEDNYPKIPDTKLKDVDITLIVKPSVSDVLYQKPFGNRHIQTMIQVPTITGDATEEMALDMVVTSVQTLLKGVYNGNVNALQTFTAFTSNPENILYEPTRISHTTHPVVNTSRQTANYHELCHDEIGTHGQRRPYPLPQDNLTLSALFNDGNTYQGSIYGLFSARVIEKHVSNVRGRMKNIRQAYQAYKDKNKDKATAIDYVTQQDQLPRSITTKGIAQTMHVINMVNHYMDYHVYDMRGGEKQNHATTLIKYNVYNHDIDTIMQIINGLYESMNDTFYNYIESNIVRGELYHNAIKAHQSQLDVLLNDHFEQTIHALYLPAYIL